LFNLITSEEPYQISEKIFFIGEIPRLTGFESQITSFVFEDGTPDYVIDDSGIVLILPEGLFVITGCGHAGIVNTLEHAKKKMKHILPSHCTELPSLAAFYNSFRIRLIKTGDILEF
jgi:7,8-dihydropterin-6-yl-methyl-4-(beta-D-ribofuranosyl)aminobenzene 5'-phosphate synthase